MDTSAEIDVVEVEEVVEYDNPNCLKQERIDFKLPHHFPQPLLVFYVITAVVSLVSNCVVIVVLWKGPNSKRHACIRWNLGVLSLSDTLLAVFCPLFFYNSLVVDWFLWDWLCPVAQFVQPFCSFFSSVTITIIAFERYLATMYPLSPVHRFFKYNPEKVIGCSALLMGCLALFPWYFSRLKEVKLVNSEQPQRHCIAEYSFPIGLIYVCTNFVFTYVIELVLVIFFYVRIVFKLKRANNNGDGRIVSIDPKRKWILIRQRCNDPLLKFCPKKHQIISTRKCYATIGMHCFCWAPIKIFQFVRYFELNSLCTIDDFRWNLFFYALFYLFAMNNSTVNPILYTFFSDNFKADFRIFRQNISRFAFRRNEEIPMKNFNKRKLNSNHDHTFL